MKLKDVAEVIKGVYLTEGTKSKKNKLYKELSMVSLEPISFLDERKLLEIHPEKSVLKKQLTKAGDVIVSLYYPMIACYVEKGQEGYVVPHYMAIISPKPRTRMDSRFIVQFINSSYGRRLLTKKANAYTHARPTTLPLAILNLVELTPSSAQIADML